MPLVKRSVAPRHLCHGAVPEGVGSRLECVTNNTLSAIIRQLSSLSKDAENVFGEIFNEANTFYVRANSLKDRIDRLAVKVIELDSSVEEVSLQDINMRKAFKCATVQDQQVVSKSSASNPVSKMYSSSDKTPPLNTFTAYREDRIDAVKFYTDPSYFFDFWKEKILQDTEEKRKEHRRQRPDLPDYPVPPGPAQGSCPYVEAHGTVPGGNTHPSPPGDHEYYSIEANYRGEGTNGICLPPADYSPVAYSTSVGLPPPCRDLHISSAQTTFGSTLGAPVPLGYPLPPVPLPPPVPPATPSPLAGHSDSAQPVGDARSDLLSAICMGIQLKKVQELQQQQSKQEPVGNDVATILSRRIALEYSHSEEDSELDYNEWSD